MAEQWTPEKILELGRGYQPACVLAAGADWDVFTHLSRRPTTAPSLADALDTNLRATTVLLDALAAMGLLMKNGDVYSVPANVADLLAETGSRNVLPMVRHQANCLRRWVELPTVTQTGRPAEHKPSIRGEAADQEAFIGAMHCICSPFADDLVATTGPMTFRHLLDIGGGSGTWTMAWLRAVPNATATVFDLPHVIPMAQERIAQAGLADRVTFAAGDFYTDPLPGGADFAWFSAIAHQNSREQNRTLFIKIHQALAADGLLGLRDVVMDESRTHPAAGAMFAVNMLVATAGGGTYTFREFREDLETCGFERIMLVRRDEAMNSVIRARKR